MDQYRDPQLATLVHLTAERPAALDFVKEADVNREEREQLPLSAFAWPEKRAFPVHTPEHAVMSRLYLEKCASAPKEVHSVIADALSVYGIDEVMFARTKVAAESEDPEDFLLPQLRKLRCKTAEDAKIAELRLLQDYPKLSVESRALACERLISKAAGLGVRLNPLMHKLAGFTISSTAVLKSWVDARAAIAEAPQHKLAYDQLSATLSRMPSMSRDRAALCKIAATLSMLDKEAGLAKFWDRRLPDPLQSVFNTEKIAEDGVPMGGGFLPRSAASGVDPGLLTDVLGPDVMREIMGPDGQVDPDRLVQVLETLPADMKAVLARHLGPALQAA